MRHVQRSCARSFLLSAAAMILIFALLPERSIAATLFGPTPYLSFASDSPFAGGSFAYFVLEDLEDNAFDPTGATVMPAGVVVVEPGTITDSVDEDDGVIDGYGLDGHSLFNPSGSTGITIAFYDGILGALPTHVGVVWTDGVGTVTFEAFDGNGTSLGTIVGAHSDGDFHGGTAEDRFYGIFDAGGIGSLRIYNTAGGIEIDHIQYGYDATIPTEQTTWGRVKALFGGE